MIDLSEKPCSLCGQVGRPWGSAQGHGLGRLRRHVLRAVPKVERSPSPPSNGYHALTVYIQGHMPNLPSVAFRQLGHLQSEQPLRRTAQRVRACIERSGKQDLTFMFLCFARVCCLGGATHRRACTRIAGGRSKHILLRSEEGARKP